MLTLKTEWGKKKSLQLKSLLVFVPRDIRVCLCGYG